MVQSLESGKRMGKIKQMKYGSVPTPCTMNYTMTKNTQVTGENISNISVLDHMVHCFWTTKQEHHSMNHVLVASCLSHPRSTEAEEGAGAYPSDLSYKMFHHWMVQSTSQDSIMLWLHQWSHLLINRICLETTYKTPSLRTSALGILFMHAPIIAAS